MNYTSIQNNDTAHGEWVRVSLFVSGCDIHCPGCCNPETQDFSCGQELTVDVMRELVAKVAEPKISGLSILGGDPLCQDVYGLMLLSKLCRHVRQTGKTVWLWTGFEWEDVFALRLYSDLPHIWRQLLLSDCDVVVDGPFKQELANHNLIWRGSSNQRIIDVQSSLRAGSVVTYQD